MPYILHEYVIQTIYNDVNNPKGLTHHPLNQHKSINLLVLFNDKYKKPAFI